jgi:hypothetical protein
VIGLLVGPALVGGVASERPEGLGRRLLEFRESLTSYRQRPATLIAAVLVSIVFYVALNLNFYYYGLAVHLHAPLFGLTGGAAATSLSLAMEMEIQLLLFGLVGAVVLLTLTTAKPVGRFISWSPVEGRSHRAD